jgi:hypothetical protein
MNRNWEKPYARVQEFNMILPQQFLLLCRLVQITPYQMLYQFACNLGQESYSNGEEAKISAKDYFLSMGC